MASPYKRPVIDLTEDDHPQNPTTDIVPSPQTLNPTEIRDRITHLKTVMTASWNSLGSFHNKFSPVYQSTKVVNDKRKEEVKTLKTRLKELAELEMEQNGFTQLDTEEQKAKIRKRERMGRKKAARRARERASEEGDTEPEGGEGEGKDGGEEVKVEKTEEERRIEEEMRVLKERFRILKDS